eukprot:9835503-Karenia_brevis.AAC.1
MIAVVQSLPNRSKILEEQLVVAHPTAREQLVMLDHQIIAQGGTLTCERCGQMWKDRKQTVEDEQCPGPEIWGMP